MFTNDSDRELLTTDATAFDDADMASAAEMAGTDSDETDELYDDVTGSDDLRALMGAATAADVDDDYATYERLAAF